MKRRELIRQLNVAGCQLLRPGSRHDIYWNPANGRRQPVPGRSSITVDIEPKYIALATERLREAAFLPSGAGAVRNKVLTE